MSTLAMFSIPFACTKEEKLNRLFVKGMELSPKHNNKTTVRDIELQNNAAASLRVPRCLSSKAITAADKVGKKSVVLESSRRQNSKGSGSFCKSDKKFMGLEGTSIYARPPLMKAVSMNRRLSRSFDGLLHREKENSINESKVYKPDDVPEKTLYMIEPNHENKSKGAAEPAMNVKFLPHTSKGKWVGETRVLKGSKTTSPHAHMSSSATSSASTKYNTTKMKNPSQQQVGCIRGKKIDTVLQGGKANNTKPKANLNAELKVKGKRADVSQSAETDGSRPKMKFQRGTVVAFPRPNSSPRKLIFKRAEMLTENERSDDLRRRSFKTKEVVKDSYETEGGTKKVVLRHQGTSSKRDSLNLNNMIEETSNELLKTRKSKVKALVGAFESVISLNT